MGRGKGRGGAEKGRKAGKKRNQAKKATSNRVVIDNSDDGGGDGNEENHDNGALTKKNYNKKGKVETGLLDQAAQRPSGRRRQTETASPTDSSKTRLTSSTVWRK